MSRIVDRAIKYRVILVRGTPGCGKSILLELVAWYLRNKRSEFKVIIIPQWNSLLGVTGRRGNERNNDLGGTARYNNWQLMCQYSVSQARYTKRRVGGKDRKADKKGKDKISRAEQRGQRGRGLYMLQSDNPKTRQSDNPTTQQHNNTTTQQPLSLAGFAGRSAGS